MTEWNNGKVHAESLFKLVIGCKQFSIRCCHLQLSTKCRQFATLFVFDPYFHFKPIIASIGTICQRLGYIYHREPLFVFMNGTTNGFSFKQCKFCIDHNVILLYFIGYGNFINEKYNTVYMLKKYKYLINRNESYGPFGASGIWITCSAASSACCSACCCQSLA